jgi:branched-chain amino acid transport system substrate-binding protein
MIHPAFKGYLMNASFRIFRIFLLASFPVLLYAWPLVSSPGKKTEQPIKFGLLVPDKGYIAARQGAELAIELANRKGGFHGRPFELETRTMEGPWGTGSKQAVDLIFNQEVWALMGSHDGRNAHLVEQAATKTKVIFLSAWTGDPTLSEAFVPWFFNCAPNNLQQATALIGHINKTDKTRRVTVFTDDDYDSQSSWQALKRRAGETGLIDPVQIEIKETHPDMTRLMDQMEQTRPGAIILFCRPRLSLEIYRRLQSYHVKQPVYGSLFIVDENVLSAGELKGFDRGLEVPIGQWDPRKWEMFRQEFKHTFNSEPGAVAAYAFDGMNVLIDAIRITGLDRDKMQESIARLKVEGVTGPLHFDKQGNRDMHFSVTRIRDGVPVQPEPVSAR